MSGIILHNGTNDLLFSHSLPLLTGEVKPIMISSFIKVFGQESTSAISWPVHDGHFKILVSLKPGRNDITLKYLDCISKITLYYEVPETVLFVCPVYVVCCDDEEGRFQGPPDQDCSIQSAQRRIAMGAKLLQTFTAEKLKEHGFGLRTFNLENDLYRNQPECHVFNSKLTLREALGMCNTELWIHFAKELMASKQFKLKDKCKWLTFLSFTRYEVHDGKVPKTHSEVLQSTKGHTALGGGGLALYGTGTLHSWAESLEQVTKCFTDSHKMDRTKFMDDSAYREYYWANYSTGLGASLHELGHTFDLAHTPTGIMARGFDDLYRVFVVQPSHTRGSTPSKNSRSASPVLHNARVCHGHSSKEIPWLNVAYELPRPYQVSKFDQLKLADEQGTKILQIEKDFKRLYGPDKQTFTQNNYDGSQVKTSITRYHDGTELVTHITIYSSGEQILQEQLRHAHSGKTRTTMSMSMWLCNNMEKNNMHQKPRMMLSYKGQSADKERSFRNDLNFQMRGRDGGAHWYRSSAVLLNYHRCTITSDNGIRLVELRCHPDGVVFHHWEFIQEPPTKFTLKKSQIEQLLPEVSDIGLLVEDDQGNILKKKINLSDLEVV